LTDKRKIRRARATGNSDLFQVIHSTNVDLSAEAVTEKFNTMLNNLKNEF